MSQWKDNEWYEQRGSLFVLINGVNYTEVRVTMINGSRNEADCSTFALGLKSLLETATQEKALLPDLQQKIDHMEREGRPAEEILGVIKTRLNQMFAKEGSTKTLKP